MVITAIPVLLLVAMIIRAAAKMKIMAACGIHVAASPADIGKTMAEALKK
jgi:succinyl-CoA synthetase alpha subunit